MRCRATSGRPRTTAPTDVDAGKLTLTNSAEDSFSSEPSGDFPYRVLTVTRYESSYDLGLAEAFESMVNADTVNIPRAGAVAPGRILFKTYEPTTDYDSTTNYLKCQYTFWLRAGTTKDADGLWDSWKYRILDAGFQGWYDDSGTKKKGVSSTSAARTPSPSPSS